MKMKITDAELLESGLVRAAVKRPETWPELTAIAQPSDFQTQDAMRAWIAIGSAWRANIDPDELFINAYMAIGEDRAKLWLFDAIKEEPLTPSPASAIRTAERIAEAAFCRRLAADLQPLALKAKDDAHADRPELLRDLADLYRKAAESDKRRQDTSIRAAVERFQEERRLNRERGGVGLSTGFRQLVENGITYQPGHLWVVGGKTSVGKTAWMTEALCRFMELHPKRRACVFSTEMTESQNVARLLANRTGYAANVIAGGNMFPQHEERVLALMEHLAGQRLNIETMPRSLTDIATICRKLNMEPGGLDIVWIDFIQNVTTPAKDDYTRMSDIARGLQALALELKCTIVCLSQLSNQAAREEHDNLEFKGAGEIAIACDVGAILKRAKEDKAQLLFEIKKHRHGPDGRYLMRFADGYTRIEEVPNAEG